MLGSTYRGKGHEAGSLSYESVAQHAADDLGSLLAILAVLIGRLEDLLAILGSSVVHDGDLGGLSV